MTLYACDSMEDLINVSFVGSNKRECPIEGGNFVLSVRGVYMVREKVIMDICMYCNYSNCVSIQ